MPRWRFEALLGIPVKDVSLYRQALTAVSALGPDQVKHETGNPEPCGYILCPGNITAASGSTAFRHACSSGLLPHSQQLRHVMWRFYARLKLRAGCRGVLSAPGVPRRRSVGTRRPDAPDAALSSIDRGAEASPVALLTAQSSMACNHVRYSVIPQAFVHVRLTCRYT